MDGELTGYPMDIKLFEAIRWVSSPRPHCSLPNGGLNTPEFNKWLSSGVHWTHFKPLEIRAVGMLKWFEWVHYEPAGRNPTISMTHQNYTSAPGFGGAAPDG